MNLVCIALALSLTLMINPQESKALDEREGPDYGQPVRTADEDEIKSLPGLNEAINFRQFSGYVRGDSGPNARKFLHYWFVESQSDPAKDPLLLWLNGGPGCSSLGGLFTELGPFQVNEDGKSLKLNDFSWNKLANVLFLESPTEVGFSYSTNLFNIHTDDTTARENHLALKGFMKKFPQYRNHSLYLSGESYAGVYLPTLGVLVDADPELNLKGLAIGNGYLDVEKLGNSLIFFGYHHGLVGKAAWDRLSKACCDGKPPTRESCSVSLGSERSWSCEVQMHEISAAIQDSGINPYNMYSDCPRTNAVNHSYARALVDREMVKLTLDPSLRNNGRPFHVLDLAKRRALEASLDPPCVDEHLLHEYLNSPEVRRAINIPSKVKSWGTCSLINYVVKYPKLKGGLSPQMNKLIDSKRNLSMLVYNGDVDTVCNFLGDEWFVEDLKRKVISEYQIWKTDGQVAGWVKHFDGITFATVRGSGHMVPGDRPREAFRMIKAFFKAHGKRIQL